MLTTPKAWAALFLLLMGYSFLGWCAEMIYCSIGQRRLCEKRGFLNGALCPIYGHGALLVLWALRGGCRNVLLTFIFGLLLTTAVEYVTSFAMENLFHMRWWDYSHYRFQINGRVCLLNSVLFGVACVLLCHAIHPRVMVLLQWLLDRHIAVPLAAVLFLIYIADIVLSVRTAVLMGDRLARLQALQEELQHKLEALAEEQKRAMEERRSQLEARREELEREFAIRRAALQDAAEERLEELEELRQAIADKKRSAAQLLTEKSEAYALRREEISREMQQRMKQLLEGQDHFERRLLRSHPTLRAARYEKALERLREHLNSKFTRK